MTTLGCSQLYQYAVAAGFSGAALDEVVAIALAESGGDTMHINNNPNGSTAVVNGKTVNVPPNTKDYGVLQINTWWNPNVSVAQAQDPTFAFKWAYQMTGGKQPSATSDPFKPYWVTVQNGAYKSKLGQCSGSSSASSASSASGDTASELFDPCQACGAKGDLSYQDCQSQVAAGNPPPCAAAVMVANAELPSNILGSSPGGAAPSTGADMLASQLASLQAAAPSTLIKVGLFLILLIVLGAGLVLVAKSDQGGNG